MSTFEERQHYLKEPIALLRQLSIYLPFFLIASMSLIYFGIASSQSFNPMAFFAVSAGFALVVVLRVLFKTPSFITEAIFLLAYNLLGGLALLFVTGVDSPFTVFWVVLLICAYANFGRIGYLVSTLFLSVTAGVYVLMLSGSLSFHLGVLFFCGFVIIVGYILAMILRLTRYSQMALMQTRGEEATQRDRLHTLLNSIAEGVLTTDPAGTIKLQNAAILALLDTNQSVIGKNIDDILHLHDEENKPVKPSSLLEGLTKATTNTHLTHRFSEIDALRLSIQITPIRTSFKGFSEPGFVFILRDITKEKTLEEERDEFISVVSHELRTPVTIAEGSLSNLMLMQDRGSEQVLLGKAAKTAHEQVLYLAKMVNDLSTLSRAERGVGDAIEDIDLHELLLNLYKKYEPEAKAKGLRLELDAPAKLPHVKTSRLYLEEMLQNFITNAIKYTQDGSVTLHGHKASGGIRLAVADTGIGISKTDQTKIFQKFYRSEDYRTRETSGTGLGLYVVKKLAAKLGVTIEFHSRLNHGSQFGFVLPLQPHASHTSQPAGLEQK